MINGHSYNQRQEFYQENFVALRSILIETCRALRNVGQDLEHFAEQSFRSTILQMIKNIFEHSPASFSLPFLEHLFLYFRSDSNESSFFSSMKPCSSIH